MKDEDGWPENVIDGKRDEICEKGLEREPDKNGEQIEGVETDNFPSI